MLMVEPQDTDKCDCGHMIKSHKFVRPHRTAFMPKIKCRFCKCRTIRL